MFRVSDCKVGTRTGLFPGSWRRNTFPPSLDQLIFVSAEKVLTHTGVRAVLSTKLFRNLLVATDENAESGK